MIHSLLSIKGLVEILGQVTQLEYAAVDYARSRLTANNPPTDSDIKYQTHALSWNVGCRMELQDSIRKLHDAAVNNNKES